MITPQFVGQYYRDTTTGNIWRSNSTTPGDWSLVLQDMQMAWTPTNLQLGELMGFWMDPNGPGLPGITTLEFSMTQSPNGFDLNAYMQDLTSVSFPNLVSALHFVIYSPVLTTLSAPLLQTIGSELDLFDDILSAIEFPSLVSIGRSLQIFQSPAATFSFPNLVSVGFGAATPAFAIGDLGSTAILFPSLTTVGTVEPIYINTCNNLTSIGFPVLATQNHLDFGSNSSLQTVTLSAWSPANGVDVKISGAALSTASVDHVLARCVANPAYVSGIVTLNGGTSSAPTSTAPGSDYAVLVGRGVTVLVNP